MTEAPAGPEQRATKRPAAPPRALGSAVLCLCSCLLAGAASAAEAPPDPDLSTESLRKVGPLWLGPYLHLRDVGYDDNVFFEAEEGEGDYTATAVPGLRALLRTGHRGGIALGQEMAYVAFADNGQLNHWNADSRVRGILLAGPAVLSLEERFRSDRERPGNEIDDRVRRRLNDVTAMLRFPRRERLGGSAALRAGSIRYVRGIGIDDIQDRLDRDHGTLEVTGEMGIRPRTTAFVETVLDDVDFVGTAQARDTRSISILPGLRLDASAPIQGEIKGGLIHLNANEDPFRSDPQDPNSFVVRFRDYRGFVGEGAVTARMGQASRLKLEGERALPFSIIENNLYAVQTRWAAGYERFFSRRLSAELKYGRTLYDYPGKIPREFPDPNDPNSTVITLEEREDRLVTQELKFHYRLGEDFALTMGAQYQTRDSTDDSLDRDRRLITFGTSVTL